MKVNSNCIIRYLRALYGGKVTYHKGAMIINVDNEEFQVKPFCRNALGNYIFTHVGTGKCFEDKDLAHGIFLAWNYKLYCDHTISINEEDWHRFINDAYKYTEEYYVNT